MVDGVLLRGGDWVEIGNIDEIEFLGTKDFDVPSDDEISLLRKKMEENSGLSPEDIKAINDEIDKCEY